MNSQIKKEKETMNPTQKPGGFAAFYLAAAYLLGIILFLVVLDYPSLSSPAQKAALVVEKQALIYTTNLLLYIIFGFFLVVMTLALTERLKTAHPTLVQSATVIGLIWAGALIASGMVANAGLAPVAELYRTDPAQAALNWQIIDGVAQGLGGGSGEILGGMFTLLVSLAGLQVRRLPRGLNYLGLGVGLFGVFSTFPGWHDLAGLFGLTQMVWFAGLGLVFLRSDPAATWVPAEQGQAGSYEFPAAGQSAGRSKP
jgi:hypothetical protein